MIPRIRSTSTLSVALLMLAPGAAAGASAAAPGGVIAELQRPAPISGHGHYLAYSTWDGARFRLTVWDSRSGAFRTPAIRSRPVPFDVDLGPDRRGRTVAVYSRCRPELSGDRFRPDSLPSYAGGGGCDVFRLDFATGQERKVTKAARSSYSEMLPTIWRDRVTFVRTPKGWTRRSRPQILVTAPGERMRSFTGGSYDFRSGPVKLDSYGRRVVLEWETAPYKCTGPDEPSGSNLGNELWLIDLTSRRRDRFARFCFQDQGPGVLRGRPSIGPLGIVTRQSRTAGPDDFPTRGPAVTVSSVRTPRRTVPVTPALCVGDVTQLDGAVAVIDRNGEPCGVETYDRVVRVIPR